MFREDKTLLWEIVYGSLNVFEVLIIIELLNVIALILQLK